MNLLNKLVLSGLSPEMPFHLRRQIQLSNYVALIICFTTFLALALRYLLFRIPPDGYIALGIVIFLIPIFLNRLHLQTLSRFFLCYLSIIFIWFILAIDPSGIGTTKASLLNTTRLYLLACSVLPYILFGTEKIWLLIIAIFPSLFSLIFHNQLLRTFGSSLNLENVGLDFQIQSFRSVIAYIIINSGYLVLLNMVARNDARNQSLIKELNEKSERIREQNESLIQKRQELSDINENLAKLVDEKTKNILKQNQILAQYAFTNAHRLRSPVAKILGFIEVSRLEPNLNYQWFFERIETEVMEIDSVLKEISRNLGSSEEQDKED